MITYVDISLKFYGGVSKSLKTYFIDIRDDIQRANMNYTLEEWISQALFTSTFVFVIC